jgi:hypothetical protein
MFAGSCCDACLGAAVRPEGTGILSRRDEPLLLCQSKVHRSAQLPMSNVTNLARRPLGSTI